MVEQKVNIIENKQSDTVTWQAKENAWKEIEKEFNCKLGGVFRDYKHLKIKYEAIKRDTRKKSALARAERYKTGGGINCSRPLTPVEEKVKQMILLSVNGEESIYDSDHINTEMSNSAISEVPNSAISEVPNSAISEMSNSASIRVDHDGAVTIVGNPNFLLPQDGKEMTIEIPCIQNVEYLNESSPKETNLQTIEDPVQEVNSSSIACVESGKWKEWSPSNLKTKKNPALQSKPKGKRPFENLAESKLEVVKLQKQILEVDMKHKIELQELEKEHLLTKIEVAKTQLEVEKRKLQ